MVPGGEGIVVEGRRVRYDVDRLVPAAVGATDVQASGPSEDGVPASPPFQPVGAPRLRRVHDRWSSASARADSMRTVVLG